MQLGRRAVAAAALCLTAALLVLPHPVRADELSGTWTGQLHGFLHYFWERSTRVILPEGGIQLESPDGVRLGADLLVDAITSASIAFAGSPDDALFTEYRYEPQLTLGKEFRLEKAKLDLTALARYSTENDYTSYSGGGISRLALNQDNTVITASVTAPASGERSTGGLPARPWSRCSTGRRSPCSVIRWAR